MLYSIGLYWIFPDAGRTCALHPFFLVCNLFLDILGYKIVISRQETIT